MNLNLDMLPENCLARILSRLNWSDLGCMFETNSRFRQICNSDSFWKLKFSHDFPTCSVGRELEHVIPLKTIYLHKLGHSIILQNQNALLRLIMNKIGSTDKETFFNRVCVLELSKVDSIQKVFEDFGLDKSEITQILDQIICLNSKRIEILNFVSHV